MESFGSNIENITMSPNAKMFTTEQLWNGLDKLAKEKREMEEVFKQVKNLCDTIVNSPPEETIKGEIESLAFELGHNYYVLNA